MTYATRQDLIERFGEEEIIELSDRADPPTCAIDVSVVEGALADADGIIDSYIGRRYGLPLKAVPKALVKIAGDMARYNLHDEDASERIKDAHRDALAFLKDVAAGRADLGVDGTEAETADNVILTHGPARVMSSDTLKDF